MKLWIVYAAAALCEIGGCFAFWAWLREGRQSWLVAPGTLALIAFAWLLTRVDTAFAGRAFAAYGGIYIGASLGWLWIVEGQRPTATDLSGAAMCVLGAIVILYGAKVTSIFLG